MSAADTSGPRPRCASCDALRLELTHAQELAQAYAEDAADEHQHVETLRELLLQSRRRERSLNRLAFFACTLALIVGLLLARGGL